MPEENMDQVHFELAEKNANEAKKLIDLTKFAIKEGHFPVVIDNIRDMSAYIKESHAQCSLIKDDKLREKCKKETVWSAEEKAKKELPEVLKKHWKQAEVKK